VSRLGAARDPLIGAVVVILLAVIPPLIGGYIVRGLTSYMIFGLLALSVGLITGYGRLFNLGAGDYVIEKGDRIAQLIVARYEPVEWQEGDELGESLRGAGGFGSSGR